MRRAELRPFILRWLGLLLVLTILGSLLLLPFAGRLLSHEDPIEHADVILALAGARVERWLEAVDLYKEGWAPRLVLSPGPAEPIENQLRARGVDYPRDGDLARDAAIALGVPPDAVMVLPGPVDNTAQEAAVFKRIVAPSRITRVIVVTSPYHTRRTGYAFRRVFADTPVRVIVRGTRYSPSQPRRWWRQRGDVRYVMSELPKLLAYVAGLGE
jgi:uncharacterized SAM-binding protein YcdF (DUF218 family)